MGISQNISGLKRDGGLWPLHSRSLHAGFWAGERVMDISQNISGLKRDEPGLWQGPYTQTSAPANA